MSMEELVLKLLATIGTSRGSNLECQDVINENKTWDAKIQALLHMRFVNRAYGFMNLLKQCSLIL